MRLSEKQGASLRIRWVRIGFAWGVTDDSARATLAKRSMQDFQEPLHKAATGF